MNQANQGNNSDAPANVPVKREWGHLRKDQSLNRGENAPRVPPGFERVIENQIRQVGHVGPLDDANNNMVGQVISGVVVAAFDAGYLLNVRVGNSNTTLRGVVLKPGHYVPISAENDVVPHFQMIRRNEIPLPTDNQTQVHGHSPQSGERNGQHINIHRNKIARRLNELPSANWVPRAAPRVAHLVASKGKQVPAVAAQAASPVLSRGNVVPVVLQPVHLSNGPANQVPPVAIEAAHLANNNMVGQVISGVAEAAFDAGYLLNVRVGNSNTTLRGVVFKPGHYVPISAENDVAHVQMIRRNEIPLPTDNQTQVHGHNPQSGERNGQHINIHRNKIARQLDESPSANRVPRAAPRVAHLVASKDKQVPTVAAQAASLVLSRGNVVPVVLQPSPVLSRGNVVPVVLQPVYLSNGPANQVPPVAIEAAHLANNNMVGQVISGVAEAAFDAGYLLNVRVGNSNTTLRGVVFKPGHYVPISAENDVAHVQMIRRNEIPLPTDNQTQVHGHNPQSGERNGQHINIHRNKIARRLNESPSANRVPRAAPRVAHLVASKGKHVPTVAAQTASPVVSRGNVVPVVLQPVHLSNGPANQVPPVATQPGHLVTLKGKQVPAVALQAAQPLNGSTPITQLPAVAHQVLSSQPQTSHLVTLKGMLNENGAPNQATAEALLEAEAKSRRLSGFPFEELVGEVIKRVRASSQSLETQIENSRAAGKLLTKDSGLIPKGELPDMNQPLQAVQHDYHDQSASVPTPLEYNGTGKMNELLQVLQENLMENQVPRVPHLVTSSRLKIHELSRPETELGDEETDLSKKCSRASSV